MPDLAELLDPANYTPLPVIVAVLILAGVFLFGMDARHRARQQREHDDNDEGNWP